MPGCSSCAYLVMSVNAHAHVPLRVASSSLQRWKWTVVNVHGNNCHIEMCGADSSSNVVCGAAILALCRKEGELNEKW